MRESATRNSPLPPSVEKAYHTKCVELKHRLTEIEDANDAARQRKQRIDRSILKMRLERAFLLERLQKVQLKSVGIDVQDSDRSVSPPVPVPTTTLPSQERAPRGRRPKSPTFDGINQHATRSIPISPNGPLPPGQQHFTPSGNIVGPPIHPQHGDYSTPTLVSQPHGFPPNPSSLPANAYPPHPIAPPPPIANANFPYHGPPIDRRAPSDIPYSESLPQIHTLPNGTNVVIINGAPKQPPWTIRDVEPRHHLRAQFESMSYQEQMNFTMKGGYTPYDIHGNPVVLHQAADARDPDGLRIRHVFRDDPQWANPVSDNVRQDDPWRRRDEAAALAPRQEAARPSQSSRRSGDHSSSHHRERSERGEREHGERRSRGSRHEEREREGGSRRSGSTRRRREQESRRSGELHSKQGGESSVPVPASVSARRESVGAGLDGAADVHSSRGHDVGEVGQSPHQELDIGGPAGAAAAVVNGDAIAGVSGASATSGGGGGGFTAVNR